VYHLSNNLDTIHYIHSTIDFHKLTHRKSLSSKFLIYHVQCHYKLFQFLTTMGEQFAIVLTKLSTDLQYQKPLKFYFLHYSMNFQNQYFPMEIQWMRTIHHRPNNYNL
jgi:hypothetical protein